MAVFITGGSGFVGLNLAQHLLLRGDDVVLFAPVPPPAAAMAILERGPGHVSLVRGDVCNVSDLDAVFAQHAIDRVIHGAAITAGLTRERQTARDIFTVNLLGTIEVLEACLRHAVPRVVQLGTGSIFGAAGTASDWLDEQSSPVLPETMYGISKFAAERTALRYRNTRGLNVSVVRLGTVFGRWEYDTGVRDTLSLPLQLLRAAEAGEAVVVHANAPDDWVYSLDVAHGVCAVLDLAVTPEPVYHLSSGMRWSLDDWCRRLRERFPAFSYRLSDRVEDCTAGRTSAAPRSPMSIARIRHDAGYAPNYLADAAFADYMAWRESARKFGQA